MPPLRTLASTPTAPENMAAFSLSVNDADAAPAAPPLPEVVDPPSMPPRTDGSLCSIAKFNYSS